MLRKLILIILVAALACPAFAEDCTAPNSGGTIDLPPTCPEGYLGPLTIVDGLPAGTTIAIEAQLSDFFNIVTAPGGALGGEVETFDGALHLNIVGTGDLAGFNRMISLVAAVEMHSAPRTAGDAVQIFAIDVAALSGAIIGDPDFDSLAIEAGTSFALPSPGQTTLTRLGDAGADFSVDSFFDLSYRIDFSGAPGSALEGLSGSTLGTDRFELGASSVATEASSFSTLKSLY